MGEKNNGILEKTSPNSPFIIHHSSFIISSISTSPKFLRSPFFQMAKLLPPFEFFQARQNVIWPRFSTRESIPAGH